jgi:hypothetical protein
MLKNMKQVVLIVILQLLTVSIQTNRLSPKTLPLVQIK